VCSNQRTQERHEQTTPTIDGRHDRVFDGLSLTYDGRGTTVIKASVVDQAALHGLLARLRDPGLPLVSVTRSNRNDPESNSLRPPSLTNNRDPSRKKIAMNNRSLETQSPSLFPVRVAAVAGLATAVIVFVNAAKRSGLIELTAATRLVAPFAQALAIVLVVGLAALAVRQSSKYSSVALTLNVLGLAAATGVEWVINLVFVELDRTQTGMLRAGPLGTAFLAASLIFLLGSILYCSALLRDGKVPRIPVVAYAVATIPIALRNFVPELVLDLALVLLGASVIWLALWMLRSKNFQAVAYRSPIDAEVVRMARPALATP
jgi:hypothetical protein